MTPDDTVAHALARANSAEVETVYVVDHANMLVGRVRVDRVSEQPAASVRTVMDEGPGTVRTDAGAADLLERMRARDLTEVPVTDPEGRLFGVIRRADLEATLAT